MWTRNPFLIWFSPTIVSITGISLNYLNPQNSILLILVLLLLAAIQLLRSSSIYCYNDFTSISPTWKFSLCFICQLFLWNNCSNPNDTNSFREPQRIPKATGVRISIKCYFQEKTIQWLYVFSGVAVILFISFYTKWSFFLVPPLIATFFEFMRDKSPLNLLYGAGS